MGFVGVFYVQMGTIWVHNLTLKHKNVSEVHFTELSGRHSVLERPLSEVNGRLFFS